MKTKTIIFLVIYLLVVVVCIMEIVRGIEAGDKVFLTVVFGLLLLFAIARSIGLIRALYRRRSDR